MLTDWSFDPLELCVIALVGTLYSRRAWTLSRRGRPAPRRRILCFAAGLLTLFIALCSPIDTIGEERLFSVHMLQHLLLGDVGALLLVLGLDGPLLQPVLRIRPLYRLRVLAHPAVALPLWAIDFCVWHIPMFMDAALRNAAIHATQHSLFVALGMLLWAALLEPLPGPAWFTAAWKVPYALVMWFVMLALAQVFLWSTHVFYAPYMHEPTLWGITRIDDQRAGGGVMLVESLFTMLPALVWILMQVFKQSEARQRLLDAGVTPAAAARAARYGRA